MTAEQVEAVALSIFRDEDQRAEYEAALIDVDAEVAAVLDRLIAAERKRERAWWL